VRIAKLCATQEFQTNLLRFAYQLVELVLLNVGRMKKNGASKHFTSCFAGIQDLNIVKYTSVIPPESESITLEEARPFLRHGAVQEAIMAKMDGVKGDRITAGVGRIQVAWNGLISLHVLCSKCDGSQNTSHAGFSQKHVLCIGKFGTYAFGSRLNDGRLVPYFFRISVHGVDVYFEHFILRLLKLRSIM
jgi:hypothetical protein